MPVADKINTTEQAASPEITTDSHPHRPAAAGAEDALAPWVALQISLRYWWLLAFLIALGGLAGWLFHLSRPPLYEAVTSFSVGIDFVQTGNMTQFEEDVAINAVGDLLHTEAVTNQVVERARAEGLDVDYQAIRRMTLADRKLNVLYLRVQHTDIALAERVAQIWVEVGWETLREAYLHAVQAERLDRYITALETCLQKSAVIEPAQPACGVMPVAEVQNSMREAGRALWAEREASRGLFAGLRLGEAEPPVVSGKPVRYGLGQSALSGSLLGLLVGVIVVQSGLLRRRLR